ncbi:MAG: RNA-directed DNA polymerase [Anaerolineales bacterium]|nr:RNA-directed DNA polymerase [Anaerolineales bacterium]
MGKLLSRSNSQIIERFDALETPKDIADLLEVDYQHFDSILFKTARATLYRECLIPKKNGEFRQINVPAVQLKNIQRRLHEALQVIHKSKLPSHGFERERSIVTNAEAHVKQKFVLNLDLKDFFPSINAGRVWGMFQTVPFNCNEKVASILANICTFKNELPQGAPTSPIVSNMLCRKLDSELQKLAKKYNATYTRYADDITISFSYGEIPKNIATTNELGQLELGNEIKNVIKNNGFRINYDKFRLQSKNMRQEVTGLTVNEFVNVNRKYVRQIRAMLHAWDKYGYEKAEEEFRREYDNKYRPHWKSNPSFKKVVKGKIDFLGMVRGKDDKVYIKYREKLRELAPDIISEPPPPPESESPQSMVPIIRTEGKTDWKHLKAALRWLIDRGEISDLQIEFDEFEETLGEPLLLQDCEALCRHKQPRPIIAIFDRDTKNVNKFHNEKKGYKDWGNNVFSFAIPVPAHRKNTPKVCIELYY